MTWSSLSWLQVARLQAYSPPTPLRSPVQIAKAHLRTATPRYLLINGNANAGTGKGGVTNAIATCAMLAKATGVKESEILPFSTGVIGEPLNMAAFERGIPAALAALSADNWARAAKGIMTTDTLPRATQNNLSWQAKKVTLNGISRARA